MADREIRWGRVSIAAGTLGLGLQLIALGAMFLLNKHPQPTTWFCGIVNGIGMALALSKRRP